MKKTTFILATLALAGSASLQAGWRDLLDKVIKEPAVDSGIAQTTDAFSQSELATALKQALDKGVIQATDWLGRENGFLDNPQVKIPIPDSLSWADKSLRTLGQGKLIEDFEQSMNHAAEKAMPEVVGILRDAVSGMTLADAETILKGPDDAATQYFRRTSETALSERIRPIVTETTQQTGATRNYKAVIEKAGFMSQYIPGNAMDLDGYVTERALDGLFLTIAQEEKRIREDPLARSTDLMRKVFQAYQP